MTEKECKEIIKDGVSKGMCQYEVLRCDACRKFWNWSLLILLIDVIGLPGIVFGIMLCFVMIAGENAFMVAPVVLISGFVLWVCWLFYSLDIPFKKYREVFLKAQDINTKVRVH